jgi:hypothetical protein
MTTTLTPRTDPTFIAPDIRIERMNTDKTRRVTGSDVEYQIFFELSGTPAPAWRTLFFKEWKDSRSIHHVELDGPFLVLHGPLREMTPAELAMMEKAVATANASYHRYAQDELTEMTRREQEWKDERTDVENVASTLHFS